MKEFSSWRKELKANNSEPEKIEESSQTPVNESQDYANSLREKLDSSGYLSNLFAGTPYERAMKPQQPTNDPITNVNERIKGLEERVQSQLSKETTQDLPKVEEIIKEAEETVEQTVSEEVVTENDTLYKLYRDREETFECNISVEGASLTTTSARLVIDTNLFSLVFYGKLYKDGRCLVPLKKMSMLPEGTRGQIRLEVIVDDTLFSPWESSCIVEGAKKVSVDIKQKKEVSVNFGKTTNG